MIERENFSQTTICAVMDYSDITEIAALFEEERQVDIVRSAMSFARDGKPIVVSLEFCQEDTILDFQYRYVDLCPGDGDGEYCENYMTRLTYGNEDGVHLVEQVCYQSFLRILKMADTSKISILNSTYK